MNGGNSYDTYGEVCFNLVQMVDDTMTDDAWGFGWMADGGVIDAYRNTFVGTVTIISADAGDGPYFMSRNVVVNAVPSADHILVYEPHTDPLPLTVADDVAAFREDQIVDPDGRLQGTVRDQYCAPYCTRGHELNMEAAISCGDGLIQGAETCDPPSSCPSSCDDGDPCTDDSTTGAAESCTLACVHQPSSAPGCGSGPGTTAASGGGNGSGGDGSLSGGDGSVSSGNADPSNGDEGLDGGGCSCRSSRGEAAATGWTSLLLVAAFGRRRRPLRASEKRRTERRA
jgi:MYXO-CTERM domain-containing protein